MGYFYHCVLLSASFISFHLCVFSFLNYLHPSPAARPLPLSLHPSVAECSLEIDERRLGAVSVDGILRQQGAERTVW